ncbi:MAG: DNA recombination/repair protein RecA, partial [Acutalibacteraceae bacterium]
LKRSGAWFYYGETRIGQGRDNVKQLFEENKELAAEIEEKIRVRYAEVMGAKGKKEILDNDEPVIMPVEAEPKAEVKHKKVNIDIAVDD